MTDKKMLEAELQHIQSYFEAKANMSIGDGKMKLLSWANAVRDALELLKEKEPRLLTL
jgi:formylmethanofuran dehydrogenase subunit B